ncbi:unnamed protein product, partial [Discosporangium mesarthrocarpum]
MLPPAPPKALHFAPATVLQLLGTPHFREFIGSLPPADRIAVREAYPGLFSVPKTTSATLLRASSGRTLGSSRAGSFALSPLLGALLHPLPISALRELVQEYVVHTGMPGVSLRGDRMTSGLLATVPVLTPRERSPGNNSHGSGIASSGDRGGVFNSPPPQSSAEGGVAGVGAGLGLGSGRRAGKRGIAQAGGIWACGSAATPPSAIDVIPDIPGCVWQGAVAGSGANGWPSPRAGSRGGGGVGPGSPPPEVATWGVAEGAGEDGLIRSSLVARFSKTYATILLNPTAMVDRRKAPRGAGAGAGVGGGGGGGGK